MASSDQKIFLFLRGAPGAGKITVARELEKQLSWRVLWLHSIKNAIQDIVKRPDLRELMREVLEPIARFMLKEGKNIIFVRPAPTPETIERMKSVVAGFPDYRFDLVTLTADEDTLIRRAIDRNDPNRIDSKERFHEYMSRSEKTVAFDDKDLLIDTSHITVEQIVSQIRSHFGY